MAHGGHLGFDPTGNGAIQSTDPENATLEQNMEWIGPSTSCRNTATWNFARWQAAAILNLIGPEVEPFDPPISRTISDWNQAQGESNDWLHRYGHLKLYKIADGRHLPFDDKKTHIQLLNINWLLSRFCNSLLFWCIWLPVTCIKTAFLLQTWLTRL